MVWRGVFLAFFLPGLAAAGPGRDTVPPSGKWIAPEPYSVIATNQVRVAVEAADNPGGSGVDRAVFYASYFDNTSHFRKRDTMGTAARFPYEAIWDCSKIADHSYRRLKFYCDLYDRAGNVQTEFERPNGVSPVDALPEIWRDSTGKTVRELNEPTAALSPRWDYFVLNRNPNRNPKTVTCPPAGEVTVDGSLSEWRGMDSLAFTNNDNLLTVYLGRDAAHLYFGIRVRDKSVISPRKHSDSINGDRVEIFLDLDNRRGQIMTPRTPQFVFAPAGMYREMRRDTLVEKTVLDPAITFRPAIQGTTGDDTDKDTGYVLEIAIPWKYLGVAPERGQVMGLDVYNIDIDFVNGQEYSVSWNNLQVSNMCNPAAWGRMTLAGPRFPRWAGALAALLLLAAAAWSLRRYRNYRTQLALAQLPEAPVKEQIQKAKEFIAAHFMEENLDRDTVAGHVCLNPVYFGALFKKETGISFIEYINQQRLKEAEQLLRATKIDISQIAYKVGFSSISSFNKTFKKAHEMSPKQYREKEQG